jgi:hypothetical protein
MVGYNVVVTSYNYSPPLPYSPGTKARADELPLLAGNLCAFNLSALLSLLNIQKQTGELTMRNYGFVAQAWVEQGELVDALLGRVHGLPALFQAMSWNEGSFSFTSSAALERTITLTLPIIQVRAALWLDRWRAVLQTIPSLGNRITVHNSPRGDVIIKPYQWSVLTRVVGGPMTVADLAHALKEDPLAVTRICVELIEMSLCQVLAPLE